MVGHTAYAVGLAVKVSCYAINIGIKLSIVFYGYCRFATGGAEDNVVKRLCITHDYNILVCVRFMLRAFSTLPSRVPPQPHTALHFVALMWGY